MLCKRGYMHWKLSRWRGMLHRFNSREQESFDTVGALINTVASQLITQSHSLCDDCRVLSDDASIQEAVPTLAGEDFSFYSHAAHVPSCFTFLGIRNEKLGTVHGLHNPKFKIDEAVLRTGAALHAALATEFLAMYPSGLSGSSKDEL